MPLNCGVGEDSWVPWTVRKSNQSTLKEINPEYSLERLMLKLKLQYFSRLMWRADSLQTPSYSDVYSQPWWRLHSSVNILKTNELDTLIGWRVPWTTRGSNQPILKEINPEYSLERLMLKLKLQYFGHLMWRAHSLEKTLMLGKIEGREVTEDEMVGWHHQVNGHDSGR